MHKRSLIISSCTIALLTVGTIFVPIAQAQTQGTGAGFIASFLGLGDPWHLVAELLAIISNWVLSIMVFWVTLTGTLLNVSVILTLHIKDFVNSVQGVYLVWQTIRDVSGIFIIFMLLYASIRLILDLDKGGAGSVGNLIKNIVIAGILINFSFFITSLLIDASNIVSLTLYNSIVGSASSQTTDASINPTQIVQNSMTPGGDGGLSGLFMKYIAPQSLISPDTLQLSQPGATATGVSQPLEIVIQGIVAGIVMFTSGLSFLLASLAFVARLAILIILLAFSPIWFAAMIFPALKEKARHFTDHLYAQLVFMPVYLLLLYAALRVLSTSSVFTNPTTNVFQGGNGLTASLWTNLMVLVINDFFIIFILNLPLVVAFSMGGSATEFLKKSVDNFQAKNVWGRFGSQAGSRTLGRAAYSLNESRLIKGLASTSPILGGLASQGLSKVSSAGFGAKKGGYEDRIKAKKKADEALHKRLGNVERGDYRTQEEYDAAKDRAKSYQEKYRANLPWSTNLKTPSGLIGFMVDNRANRQTASKLNKKADDEAIKKAEKGNRKQMEDLKKELASLDEKSPLVLSGRIADEVEQTKKAKRDEINRKMEDLQEKIDKAQEIKDEERDQKIMNKLDELEKKEGSGGGEKKEDKK